MNTFRSIDELVKMFEREKVLLKEMFYKRIYGKQGWINIVY